MIYEGEAKWAWLVWFGMITLVGGLIIGGVAVAQEIHRQQSCTDLGGVYHRGLCLDPSKLIKV